MIARFKPVKLTLYSLLVLVPGLTVCTDATAENPKPVTIENVPLPVMDIGHQAVQPHQASVHILVSGIDNGEEQATLTSVPEGKLLIIETVTGLCFKGTATASHRIAVETTGGGSTVEFNVPSNGVGEYTRFSSANTWEGTTSTTGVSFGGAMRLYADSGTDVVAYARRNVTTGDTSCWVSIAGQLVDS